MPNKARIARKKIVVLLSAFATLFTLTACDYFIDVENLEIQCSTGDNDACVEAAASYLVGHRVEVDIVQSYKLFSVAAENGHVIAQLQLASFYENGLAVDKDLFQSYVWYKAAAMQGNEKSLEKVKEISQLLTKDEISIASERAASFIKGIQE